VSGYLGGLPLIGGPITLFLALDYGTSFAARSASVTLAAILAQAAHLIVFARVGRRARWPVALASGWFAYAGVAAAVAAFEPPPLAAAALAASGLAAAWRWLPRAQGAAPVPTIPAAELRLRLVVAVVLAAIILWGARVFGPVVSGVLLSVPVTGSILPPFTLALHGAEGLARLMRGFVIGLSGFAAFFFVVASCAAALGVMGAFLVALAAAPATLFAVTRVASRFPGVGTD
jgi:hypothetical protein